MTAVNLIKNQSFFLTLTLTFILNSISSTQSAYPQDQNNPQNQNQNPKTPNPILNWNVRLSAGIGSSAGKIVGPDGSATSYFYHLQGLYYLTPQFGLGIETGYIHLYRNGIYPSNHDEFGNQRFIPIISLFEYSIADHYIFLQTGLGFLFKTSSGKSETPFVASVQIGFEYPLFHTTNSQISIFASGKQYFLPIEVYRNSVTFNLGTSLKF